MSRCTHQDGQHNILKVIPQVGGIGAEENEVALYKLQKSDMKHSVSLDLSTRHSARSSQKKSLEEAADGVVCVIYSHPGRHTDDK